MSFLCLKICVEFKSRQMLVTYIAYTVTIFKIFIDDRTENKYRLIGFIKR